MTELKEYWWDKEKNTAHENIFAILQFLSNNQGWIREGHLRHMRLYGNLNVMGLSVNTYSQNAAVNPPYDRLGLNIVQSMCDTVTQKICKNKPKPMFLTEGGNRKLQQKAKLLNRFVEGQFYQTKLYERTAESYRDGTVFGSGFVKIFRDGDEIKVERTFPGEVQCDEAEGIYGSPRNLYQNKYVPKEYLMKLYPEFADKIRSVQSAQTQMPGHKNLADHCWVAESWHLPTNKDSKDGRHIICIQNATLIDEEYAKSYFPFIKLDWSKRLLGYFGQGIAEQLTGIQVEVNKILRTIQMAFHLCGIPKVYLEMGSKVVKTQLNNEVGSLVWYHGSKPITEGTTGVDPQLFQHLNFLYQRAYEIIGISQLAAQSKKPAGLDSGKALREFNDIESERFILSGQMWENAHLEAARMMIDIAKDIAADGGDYSVMAKDKNSIEVIKWSDVNLDDDKYAMHLYPTSFLSQTPAGKMQDVMDLVQAGFIDQANALKLLDFPDLESFEKFKNGPTNSILMQIDAIIDDGEYHSPEPFQPLQQGIELMQSAYLYAKTQKVSEERLEMMRRWLEEAHLMLQPPAPALPVPGPAPLAVPEAPPVSGLLPSAPGVI